MTENLCARCGRPTPDGVACANCAYRAGDQLHETADMTPAARDVAHGLTRHGAGGGSGKPGSRMPFDTMATQKLDRIQARFSTWVGEIAHARGRPIPAPRHLGDDPIILWARWLAGHVEWIRKTDDAERFLIEVDECVRAMRSVVRGPAEQKYLGPCGARISVTITNEMRLGVQTEVDCDGDVYAYRGAKTGRCRTCGIDVAAAEREAWLDEEVGQHAYTARQIADAYSIPVKTIRSWANRGQLRTYWRTAAALTVEWADTEDDAELAARGPRLHYVADVRTLAKAEADRRRENQIKRERRQAAREQGESAA